MKFVLILLPIFFLSIVQVAHAQSLTDSINNAVNNDIGNTFDSINQAANSNSNSLSGNDTGSQSTTTPPQLLAVLVIQIPPLQL